MLRLRCPSWSFHWIPVLGFAALIATGLLFSRDAVVSLTQMLQPPSPQHWLGTDNLGRDLGWRLGSAVVDSVLPMWLAVVVASLLGHLIAMLHMLASSSSWLGKPAIVIRIGASILAAVPAGIAAFAAAAWYEQANLAPVLFTLSCLFGLRAYLATVELYERDRGLGYWLAHSAMGGSISQRIIRYGFARTWQRPLLENLGFHLRAAVAIEAAISYLGFGIQEPRASFGNMMASHFDLYLHGSWLTLLFIIGALAVCTSFPSAILNVYSDTVATTSREVLPASPTSVLEH